MLVNNFSENYSQYKNFEIWQVENMDAFFSGNKVLEKIFTDEYKMPVADFNNKRSEIAKTDMEIMKSLLDQVGDKHFFIFTLNDPNHRELIVMQGNKIMNFGVDIADVQGDNVYIMIMDKAAGMH